MKQLILLIVCLFFGPGLVWAGSVDVIRGEDMAEQGALIEKYGITLLPHAEVEYRYEDIEISNGGATAGYPAFAGGLLIKHHDNLYDFYFKTPLCDNSSGSEYLDLKDNSYYGVSWSRILQPNNLYVSLALEYKDINFREKLAPRYFEWVMV